MYKKLLFLSAALLLGFCVIGKPALAAEFKSGQMVNISAADKINGDLYAAANDVSIDNNLPGDAFLAGSIIRVSGSVGQSLMAAGSMVNVMGPVGHALRVAGSQVTIGSTVEGDVMAAGGMVYILPSAVIKGDLYLASGSAIIEGKVMGNIKATGGEVALRGEVGKDVYVESEGLALGPQAKLDGKLTYKAPKEATMADGSKVAGGVDFKKVEKSERGQIKAEKREINWQWILVWFLGMLAISLVAAYLGNYFFKQRVADITNNVLNNFAKQMGWGFVWLVVVPIACLILLVTIIGIPFSIFACLVYALAITLAKVLAGIILGSWLWKLITKKGANGNGKGWPVDWKVILLGIVLISLLSLIPIIGWVIVFIFFLAALGGIMTAAKAIAK
ncbi:MAG: bactofilin family protein [Patescibacteria group bacterium]